jgi:AcrR family transcriptional regulator
MRKSRFTAEEVVKILREADKTSLPGVAKKHGLSERTLYLWRRRFATTDARDAKRLKVLEAKDGLVQKGAGTRATPPSRTHGVGSEGGKRRRTRERIIAAAMSLFFEKGYEAVTITEIAKAARLNYRSFFNYFATKEDVVETWQDQFGVELVAAVAVRPLREPLVVVVEEALKVASAAVSPHDIAVDRLIGCTPALMDREKVKYAQLENVLACALAQRVPGDCAQFRANLLAMIVVGTLRLASAERRRCDSVRSSAVPEYFSSEVFQTLWDELRDIGAAGLAARSILTRFGLSSP